MKVLQTWFPTQHMLLAPWTFLFSAHLPLPLEGETMPICSEVSPLVQQMAKNRIAQSESELGAQNKVNAQAVAKFGS